MRAAVVINVGVETSALPHAARTQALLLEHMGARLDSIRLAAPRLLRNACLAAIGETPDLLVIAGGPRAARRAGQIAYESHIPIVFLPGLRTPGWATRLWGSLSLEDLVGALAREEFFPMKLGAGCVAGQIFFDSASCGFLSQVEVMRQAYREAESLTDAWTFMGRAAALAGLLPLPAVRFRCDNVVRSAGTLFLTPQDVAQYKDQSRRHAVQQRFSCVARRHGLLSFATGWIVGDAKDRHANARAESFDCSELTIEDGATTWLLLDGDPVHVDAPMTFRILPQAVETFTFSPQRIVANDNGAPRGRRSARGLAADKGASGNFRPRSHVPKANAGTAGKI